MNAILICTKCQKKFDKGCPAQPGQDDSTFVCEDCSNDMNKKELAKHSPTIEVDGGKK